MQLPFAADVGHDDLPANSRYYLAMKALWVGENLDALALRCWPELPNRFAQWPYLAMARLAEEGHVVALEGDVDGAPGRPDRTTAGIGHGLPQRLARARLSRRLRSGIRATRPRACASRERCGSLDISTTGCRW